MLRTSLFVLLLAACSSSFAATAQQDKMTTCNADAKTKALAGDARKAFMSNCLKATPAAPAAAETAQDRMRRCNKTAGEQQLLGDTRKTFMSTCLKKP